MELRLSSALFMLAWAPVLAAQTPRLIVDLDTTPMGNAGSNPKDPLSVGSSVYFSAEAVTTGRELYFMDGQANVSLVADLWLGEPGSDPVPLAEANNQLLFAADDGIHGRELWRTTPLARFDINPGTGSSNPTVLGRLGNTILLVADDGAHGPALWSSTGGTPSFVSAVRPSGVSAVMGNTLFFTGSNGATGQELWKTDGTPSGTMLVRDITPGPAGSRFGGLLGSEMVAIQPNVFFNCNGDLFVSDGTAANTRLLPIRPGNGSGAFQLKVVGTTLVFSANDGTHGFELWRANGSTVSLVADIWPGANSGTSDFSPVPDTPGTQLFFWADDGVHGREPWIYDGVNNQVRLFADLAPGTPSTRSDGGIYLTSTTKAYIGVEAPSGKALWGLDFFASTATRINLAFSSGSFRNFVGNGAQIAFEIGADSWLSGGTQSTTVRTGFASGAIHPLPTLPGFFIGTNASSLGVEPYMFANATPWLLRDIWQPGPGSTIGFSSLFQSDAVELHGQLLFQAEDSTHGGELWRTDGTAAGTVMVKDIVQGPGFSNPRFTMRLGEQLYGIVRGNQLWRTDGTGPGTVQIRAFNIDSLRPGVVLGRQLIFSADGELWQSDGTTAGTTQLANINLFGDSSPGKFTRVGNTVFFAAKNGQFPDPSWGDLWKTDGTASGTVRVADYFALPYGLAAAGSTLFFYMRHFEGGELWKSDGTAANTVLVKDIFPGTESGIPDELGLDTIKPSQAVTGNGVLVFVARDSNDDFEVWRSDGTNSGTFRLADIMPGIESSRPAELTSAFGYVYFTAESPGIGRELWETDGTSAGTRLVANIGTGAYSGDPGDFRQLGSRYLWFSATATDVGRELFAYEPFSQVLRPMGDFRPGPGSGNPKILGLAGPNLIVAANDGVHGYPELFEVDEVATSYTYGTGCGPSTVKPGLLVNDPWLGTSLAFTVFGLPPGEVSMLSLGTRAFPPSVLAPDCALYIGQQLDSVLFISGPTSFVHRIPVPNDPALIGITIAAQAGSLSANGELRTTNGVQCTVGR